jgi:NDP-sugar pyrophosphorylase family protein
MKMKAMILAAGLGSRLRPLTDNRPKALVEVNGRTMLEITLSRLRSFGIREVIVNVHHFADMIVEYLKTNDNFGMRIEVSRENVLLDTGGGLKKAANFFVDRSVDGSVDSRRNEDENEDEQPFIVHNVDVLSTIDLRRMVQFHTANRALATLAVQGRETPRYLLFDDEFRLCGRRSEGKQSEIVTPSEHLRPLAFSGIHVISPRLLAMMTEDGAFSIVTTYLRLAAQQEKILAFRADEYYWRDLGKPENLELATQDLQLKVITQ